MAEKDILTALDELVRLGAEGKPMDAFDKFYHDDLERTELDGSTIVGKVKNREAAVQLLSKVTAFRDFSRVGQLVRGDRSFLVWSVDLDHADNGQLKVVEVAIQDWKDGKIIREKFVA
ncbi:MAG: nuclear transport factor 2 family protein [Rhizobacter sp.]|nr:nuclear transport factor 2 family protein [Chlorobiales bacterium]